MITRTLVAALVGLSLAAGTLGAASAQTTQPVAQTTPANASASPADAAAPTAATKVDTTKKATAHPKHRTSMKAKAHRKHVARHAGTKTARASTKAGKRIHVSHLAKRGTHKPV